MKRKILNIGCGVDSYGTHRMDAVKRNGVTTVGSVEEPLPFEDNFFDEVYAKNIFEHLGNPLNFLLECKRVLIPGGVIKIITDNGNCLLYLWNRIGVLHADYRWRGDAVDEKDMHYQFFQPEHIRNYFWRAGFKKDTIKISLIKGVNWNQQPIFSRIKRNLMKFLLGERLGCLNIQAEARIGENG